MLQKSETHHLVAELWSKILFERCSILRKVVFQQIEESIVERLVRSRVLDDKRASQLEGQGEGVSRTHSSRMATKDLRSAIPQPFGILRERPRWRDPGGRRSGRQFRLQPRQSRWR